MISRWALRVAAIAMTIAPLSRATSTCIMHGQVASSTILAGTGATDFSWDDQSPSIDGFVSFHVDFGVHGSLSCMGTAESWSMLQNGNAATLRALCGNLLLVEVNATPVAVDVTGTVRGSAASLDGNGNGTVTLTIDASASGPTVDMSLDGLVVEATFADREGPCPTSSSGCACGGSVWHPGGD